MRQQLPQQTTRQMPDVARPHALGREPLAELAEYGLDAVTNAANDMGTLWPLVEARLLVGHEHLKAEPVQPLVQLRLPVSAIRETDAPRRLRQFFQQRHV